MAVDKDSVVLGSGKLYGVEYDPATGVPEDAVFEVDANTFGRISGGASLEYKPTEYAVEDDDGQVVTRFITKEEVTFKSGILTWALENLARLSPAVVTDDTVKHIRTLKLGGSKSLKAWAVRFVHTKDDGNKVRVTLVGTAGSGFSLKFDKEKETVTDAEFKALSQNNGLLVEIAEEYTPAA